MILERCGLHRVCRDIQTLLLTTILWAEGGVERPRKEKKILFSEIPVTVTQSSFIFSFSENHRLLGKIIRVVGG